MDDVLAGTKGIAAAVEVAVEESDARPDFMDGEQLALLPLCQANGAAPVRKNDGSAGRGRGRPAGSKNKRTEEWTDYLLSRYPSPLEALANTAFRPVRELAADLGYINKFGRVAKPDDLKELLKIQIAAAKELAPYLHQKQPTAIDTGDRGLVNLIIGDISGGAPRQKTDDFVLEFMDLGSEENQGVIKQENENSNVYNSNVSQEIAEDSGSVGDKPSD